LVNSKIIVTSAALVLFACGSVLLFAPVEVVPAAPLVAQWLGSALLGLAAVDWTGRSSSVGGIYGRALLMGNLVTFNVGGLVTLRAFLNVRNVDLLIIATISLILGASFGWLLMRGGVPR
jgi:hypothetical protein